MNSNAITNDYRYADPLAMAAYYEACESMPVPDTLTQARALLVARAALDSICGASSTEGGHPEILWAARELLWPTECCNHD